MRRELACPLPARVDRDEVLARWRWFRAALARIHGACGFPESFGGDEGEISVIERLVEGDPDWDFRPAELNYESRAQTVRFVDGAHRAEIHVYQSEMGDHFTIEYLGVGERVRLFASRLECRLELDDASPTFDAWRVLATR